MMESLNHKSCGCPNGSCCMHGTEDMDNLMDALHQIAKDAGKPPKKMNWDEFYMGLVFYTANKSEDPMTHIGAVIVGPENEVVSIGFNGLPRGVDESPLDRHDRNCNKYSFYEHAERNSIYNSARIGAIPKGCKMYTNGIPCADCARGVIQSGIKEVIVWNKWELEKVSPKWIESCKLSKQMLEEAGVKIKYYEGAIPNKIFGFRDGKVIDL